ncbi:uncharacterized protein LOC108680564 isoform X2 [Hyalella azteca]|uniref:Uncharacterized protein LOC108680564 isoform X2 n=1 Tax=Hyalella azteca TaxID=294128 RepID=A0A8B7PFL1_HYAAZ|nr:uncharacterized protein LOC108680564 isoform X2 [Hyalella azteca]
MPAFNINCKLESKCARAREGSEKLKECRVKLKQLTKKEIKRYLKYRFTDRCHQHMKNDPPKTNLQVTADHPPNNFEGTSHHVDVVPKVIISSISGKFGILNAGLQKTPTNKISETDYKKCSKIFQSRGSVREADEDSSMNCGTLQCAGVSCLNIKVERTDEFSGIQPARNESAISAIDSPIIISEDEDLPDLFSITTNNYVECENIPSTPSSSKLSLSNSCKRSKVGLDEPDLAIPNIVQSISPVITESNNCLPTLVNKKSPTIQDEEKTLNMQAEKQSIDPISSASSIVNVELPKLNNYCSTIVEPHSFSEVRKNIVKLSREPTSMNIMRYKIMHPPVGDVNPLQSVVVTEDELLQKSRDEHSLKLKIVRPQDQLGPKKCEESYNNCLPLLSKMAPPVLNSSSVKQSSSKLPSNSKNLSSVIFSKKNNLSGLQKSSYQTKPDAILTSKNIAPESKKKNHQMIPSSSNSSQASLSCKLLFNNGEWDTLSQKCHKKRCEGSAPETVSSCTTKQEAYEKRTSSTINWTHKSQKISKPSKKDKRHKTSSLKTRMERKFRIHRWFNNKSGKRNKPNELLQVSQQRVDSTAVILNVKPLNEINRPQLTYCSSATNKTPPISNENAVDAQVSHLVKTSEQNLDSVLLPMSKVSSLVPFKSQCNPDDSTVDQSLIWKKCSPKKYPGLKSVEGKKSKNEADIIVGSKRKFPSHGHDVLTIASQGPSRKKVKRCENEVSDVKQKYCNADNWNLNKTNCMSGVYDGPEDLPRIDAMTPDSLDSPKILPSSCGNVANSSGSDSLDEEYNKILGIQKTHLWLRSIKSINAASNSPKQADLSSPGSEQRESPTLEHKQQTSPTAGNEQFTLPAVGNEQWTSPNEGQKQYISFASVLKQSTSSTARNEQSTSSTAQNEQSTSLTAGQEQSTSPTAGQEPSTSPTAGQESSTSPTAGQKQSTSPTAGQEPSTSPAAGQKLSTSPTAGQKQSTSLTAGHEQSTSPAAGQEPSKSPTAGQEQSPLPAVQQLQYSSCSTDLRVDSEYSLLMGINSKEACKNSECEKSTPYMSAENELLSNNLPSKEWGCRNKKIIAKDVPSSVLVCDFVHREKQKQCSKEQSTFDSLDSIYLLTDEQRKCYGGILQGGCVQLKVPALEEKDFENKEAKRQELQQQKKNEHFLKLLQEQIRIALRMHSSNIDMLQSALKAKMKETNSSISSEAPPMVSQDNSESCSDSEVKSLNELESCENSELTRVPLVESKLATSLDSKERLIIQKPVNALKEIQVSFEPLCSNLNDFQTAESVVYHTKKNISDEIPGGSGGSPEKVANTVLNPQGGETATRCKVASKNTTLKIVEDRSASIAVSDIEIPDTDTQVKDDKLPSYECSRQESSLFSNSEDSSRSVLCKLNVLFPHLNLSLPPFMPSTETGESETPTLSPSSVLSNLTDRDFFNDGTTENNPPPKEPDANKFVSKIGVNITNEGNQNAIEEATVAVLDRPAPAENVTYESENKNGNEVQLGKLSNQASLQQRPVKIEHITDQQTLAEICQESLETSLKPLLADARKSVDQWLANLQGVCGREIKREVDSTEKLDTLPISSSQENASDYHARIAPKGLPQVAGTSNVPAPMVTIVKSFIWPLKEHDPVPMNEESNDSDTTVIFDDNLLDGESGVGKLVELSESTPDAKEGDSAVIDPEFTVKSNTNKCNSLEEGLACRLFQSVNGKRLNKSFPENDLGENKTHDTSLTNVAMHHKTLNAEKCSEGSKETSATAASSCDKRKASQLCDSQQVSGNENKTHRKSSTEQKVTCEFTRFFYDSDDELPDLTVDSCPTNFEDISSAPVSNFKSKTDFRSEIGSENEDATEFVAKRINKHFTKWKKSNGGKVRPQVKEGPKLCHTATLAGKDSFDSSIPNKTSGNSYHEESERNLIPNNVSGSNSNEGKKRKRLHERRRISSCMSKVINTDVSDGVLFNVSNEKQFSIARTRHADVPAAIPESPARNLGELKSNEPANCIQVCINNIHFMSIPMTVSTSGQAPADKNLEVSCASESSGSSYKSSQPGMKLLPLTSLSPPCTAALPPKPAQPAFSLISDTMMDPPTFAKHTMQPSPKPAGLILSSVNHLPSYNPAILKTCSSSEKIFPKPIQSDHLHTSLGLQTSTSKSSDDSAFELTIPASEMKLNDHISITQEIKSSEFRIPDEIQTNKNVDFSADFHANDPNTQVKSTSYKIKKHRRFPFTKYTYIKSSVKSNRKTVTNALNDEKSLASDEIVLNNLDKISIVQPAGPAVAPVQETTAKSSALSPDQFNTPRNAEENNTNLIENNRLEASMNFLLNTSKDCESKKLSMHPTPKLQIIAPLQGTSLDNVAAEQDFAHQRQSMKDSCSAQIDKPSDILMCNLLKISTGLPASANSPKKKPVTDARVLDTGTASLEHISEVDKISIAKEPPLQPRQDSAESSGFYTNEICAQKSVPLSLNGVAGAVSNQNLVPKVNDCRNEIISKSSPTSSLKSHLHSSPQHFRKKILLARKQMPSKFLSESDKLKRRRLEKNASKELAKVIDKDAIQSCNQSTGPNDEILDCGPTHSLKNPDHINSIPVLRKPQEARDIAHYEEQSTPTLVGHMSKLTAMPTCQMHSELVESPQMPTDGDVSSTYTNVGSRPIPMSRPIFCPPPMLLDVTVPPSTISATTVQPTSTPSSTNTHLYPPLPMSISSGRPHPTSTPAYFVQPPSMPLPATTVRPPAISMSANSFRPPPMPLSSTTVRPPPMPLSATTVRPPAISTSANSVRPPPMPLSATTVGPPAISMSANSVRPPIMSTPYAVHCPMTCPSTFVPPPIMSAHVPPSMISAHVPPLMMSAQVPPPMMSAHVPPPMMSAHVPPPMTPTSATLLTPQRSGLAADILDQNLFPTVSSQMQTPQPVKFQSTQNPLAEAHSSTESPSLSNNTREQFRGNVPNLRHQVQIHFLGPGTQNLVDPVGPQPNHGLANNHPPQKPGSIDSRYSRLSVRPLASLINPVGSTSSAFASSSSFNSNFNGQIERSVTNSLNTLTSESRTASTAKQQLELHHHIKKVLSHHRPISSAPNDSETRRSDFRDWTTRPQQNLLSQAQNHESLQSTSSSSTTLEPSITSTATNLKVCCRLCGVTQRDYFTCCGDNYYCSDLCHERDWARHEPECTNFN